MTSDSPAQPYPQGFVYGRGEADPRAWSLSGLKIARALAALAPVRGRVLELGCGGGQYLRALRRHRPDLSPCGVDLDDGAVAEAGRIPGVESVRADVQKLPFQDGVFAAVIGFDILEHVPDPACVLAEACRVLAPGGVLHMYVPCEGNPGTVYVRRGHALKARWGGHVQQLSTDRLEGLIREAGFELRAVRHADYTLTQEFDYLFFSRLARSRHPQRLWAAHALTSGGGPYDALLRLARHALSALAWLEGTLRSGRHGAMSAHVTAVKKNGP